MPPISPIKILGSLVFMADGHTLSMKLENAYVKARYKKDMGAVPKQLPIPWFKNSLPGYKPYQKSCDEIGQAFQDFHDAMIDAVQYSHNMWKLQAKFKDLKVMALCAIGTPGCLDGPELESNIKNAPMVMAFKDNMAKHRDAVAAGVSKCFKKWQDKVMVPGLPWYPAFVAFPGPTAPPMPNIPMPLIMCPSPMMTQIIMPDDMAKAMDDALPKKLKDLDPDKQWKSLHKAIATTLALAFLMWLPQQMIMLVLGKGPIPTFAPPYVPVGPVVGGDNIAVPGHLMA